MLTLQIIAFCLGLIVYVLGGLVCGRICVEIVREKNAEMSEVLWFWLGCLFNVFAIVLTLIVKNKAPKQDEKEEKE